MLAPVLLAFALDLDTGAVHEQMQCALRSAIRYGNVQSILAARQCAEIRHGPAGPHWFSRLATNPVT